MNQHAFIENCSGVPTEPPIQAARRHLAARAEGQTAAVKRAVANLDRWLEVMTEPPETREGVDVKACVGAAVDALESALQRPR